MLYANSIQLSVIRLAWPSHSVWGRDIIRSNRILPTNSMPLVTEPSESVVIQIEGFHRNDRLRVGRIERRKPVNPGLI
jgi:hypothetical protein